MSNFSNIGFDVESEDEFFEIVDQVYELGNTVSVENGYCYSVYSEDSGVELWLQLDDNEEMLGVNPHYRGKSRRTVCIVSQVEREDSELDGAFYAWADPLDEGDAESGAYPFVFDLPDFRTVGKFHFPYTTEIQLSAFAQEIEYHKNEKAFEASQKDKVKIASEAFITTGLFMAEEQQLETAPEALGIFSGKIIEVEKKKNLMTDTEFYWFLVETLGGEVDVVAELSFFNKTPQVGGLLFGEFWLSAQLIDPPEKNDENFWNGISKN